MKEKNKKFFDVLIPLIAFVIIVQSIVIVTSFKKASDANQDVVEKPTASEELEKKQDPVYNLVFSTPSTEMEKGKSYPVVLKALSDTNNAIDAVSLYIKYDKEAFTVSNLEFSDKLPKPGYSKISDKVGMVVVHYFVSEANGLAINKDETFDLLGFEIVPKKSGDFKFEISTGNDGLDSVTMIVDNATTKLLPISSNALNVEVK
jgi:hypothetical protein